MALARASRWRSPPESWQPPGPIGWLKPWGNAATNCDSPALRMASWSFIVRRGGPHKAKVEGHRSIKQYGVARQITDVSAQILELNVPDIHVSDANRSGIRVVESCYESCERALSGTVLPSDSDLFARQDAKGGDVEHFGFAFDIQT